ncbi:MAG: RNA polymerase sigma factor [Clostridia bacterium]|nr:RNA polymerase sigma factor [Clostridia bacterium]
MGIEQYNLIQEVIKLKQGDGKAFEKIYNLTNRSAYFTALKIVSNEADALDVLQESYMLMLDKIGDLENPEAFSKWFNMIVANKAKELLRKNNKYLFIDDVYTLSDEDSAAFTQSIADESEEFKPGTLIEQLELKSQVMALIDGLSDDKRTAILLYYYNDLSIKEISKALKVNENTVKSRLFYAKKDLANGIREIEKKNGKLLGAAPSSVVAWALKTAATTASTAFVSSGAAAETLAAVTTGAAMAGSLAVAGTASTSTAAAVVTTGAATGVLQKITAGIAAVTVIGSAATVLMRVQRQRISAENMQNTSQVEEFEEITPGDRREALMFVTEETGTFATIPEEETALPASERTTAPETATEKQTTLKSVQATTVKSSTAQSTKWQRTTRAGRTTTARATKAGASTTAVPSTTSAKPTETTAKPSTTAATRQGGAGSANPAATAENRTSATTAATTTAQTTEAAAKTATVEIAISQSGTPAGTIGITLNEGDTFTFEDAKRAVAAKGYDTSFAVYSGELLPLNAEAGKKYFVEIDVE